MTALGTEWSLGAIGVAKWTGARLRDVLALAGLEDSAAALTSQVVKSALELQSGARLSAGPRRERGRAWSPHGRIARVSFQIDGGAWRSGRLIGPNFPRAWARFEINWLAQPGEHDIRVRATDEFGHTQLEATPWNDHGYLYRGSPPHPIVAL